MTLSVLSFAIDAFIRQNDIIGAFLGVAFFGYGFVSYIWREFRLKESYCCKRCAKRLHFSEPDAVNEIRYFCFDCHIEYRVRTDGKYDIDLPETPSE